MDIFIALVLLSFLGLVVGLSKPSLFKQTRKRISFIFGGGMVVFFILFGVTAPSDDSNTAIDSAAPIEAAAESNSVQVGTETAAKPAAITGDIRVTSQTVKKVDGKFRYFFDIRNNGSMPSEGSVRIELLKDDGSVIGRDTFATAKPIQPGYGDSVYFDISTGPIPEYDRQYAVVGFHYEATEGGKIVSQGEGVINR